MHVLINVSWLATHTSHPDGSVLWIWKSFCSIPHCFSCWRMFWYLLPIIFQNLQRMSRALFLNICYWILYESGFFLFFLLRILENYGILHLRRILHLRILVRFHPLVYRTRCVLWLCFSLLTSPWSTYYCCLWFYVLPSWTWIFIPFQTAVNIILEYLYCTFHRWWHSSHITQVSRTHCVLIYVLSSNQRVLEYPISIMWCPCFKIFQVVKHCPLPFSGEIIHLEVFKILRDSMQDF